MTLSTLVVRKVTLPLFETSYHISLKVSLFLWRGTVFRQGKNVRLVGEVLVGSSRLWAISFITLKTFETDCVNTFKFLVRIFFMIRTWTLKLLCLMWSCPRLACLPKVLCASWSLTMIRWSKSSGRAFLSRKTYLIPLTRFTKVCIKSLKYFHAARTPLKLWSCNSAVQSFLKEGKCNGLPLPDIAVRVWPGLIMHPFYIYPWCPHWSLRLSYCCTITGCNISSVCNFN